VPSDVEFEDQEERRLSYGDYFAGKPAVPFSIPAGIKLIRIDPRTGMRVGPGHDGRIILEAFKPGTAPPDSYAVLGGQDGDGRAVSVSPDADRFIRSGSGLW
jgi:penicillin-binding protein 1A